MILEERIVGYEKTIQFNGEINIDNYEFMHTNTSFIGDNYMVFETPLLINKYETCVDVYMDRKVYCSYEMIDFSEFL